MLDDYLIGSYCDKQYNTSTGGHIFAPISACRGWLEYVDYMIMSIPYKNKILKN